MRWSRRSSHPAGFRHKARVPHRAVPRRVSVPACQRSQNWQWTAQSDRVRDNQLRDRTLGMNTPKSESTEPSVIPLYSPVLRRPFSRPNRILTTIDVQTKVVPGIVHAGGVSERLVSRISHEYGPCSQKLRGLPLGAGQVPQTRRKMTTSPVRTIHGKSKRLSSLVRRGQEETLAPSIAEA